MKKLIFIALISALALNMASCDKKDGNGSPIQLVGTTWIASGVEGGHSWSQTLSFLSESTGTFHDQGDPNGWHFTYSYTHPNISIMDEDEIHVAIVKGNTITLWGDIYIKQ